jgi:dolichol-phosphate mannosyltransferase
MTRGAMERSGFRAAMVSIILPTYNEAPNMKLIIPALSKILDDAGLAGEILVMDDNSPDGTAGAAEAFAVSHPVKVHVRKEERGLSRAVIEGFHRAGGEVCVVMDADLSHPVEAIPSLVKPIFEGRCDVTVGSRYVAGGGSENWSLTRKVVSRGAGMLAKGVTSLSDPTSGFMAVRKSILDGVNLDPLGWKIVLEVVVKAKGRVQEIPIVFADRQEGQSKLGFKAQVDYLVHLWHLYCHKFPAVKQFIKFCLVGVSGLFVDTAILVGLVDRLFLDPRLAAVFAFFAAVSWNYLFNRIWSFRSTPSTSVLSSYLSFVFVCLAGLGIRVGVMHVLIEYAGMGQSPWYVLASLAGIGVATVFNFFGSKFVVFSRKTQEGVH